MAKPNRLTDKKIASLWKAWCERQSIAQVAHKCRVSENTVRRYRRIGKWDARLAAIKKAAGKKSDETEAERLARHAQIGKLLQAKGVKTLQDLGDKGIEDEGDAIKAIGQGIDIERKALGDDVEIQKDVTVTIKFGPGNGDD